MAPFPPAVCKLLDPGSFDTNEHCPAGRFRVEVVVQCWQTSPHLRLDCAIRVKIRI